MPQDPDEKGAVTDVELDDSKKYIAKLIELIEQDKTGEFAKPGQRSLVFKFNLYDQETGVAVLKADDTLYEHWMFVDTKTFHDKGTGQIAPARELANSLLDKTLTDDEIRAMNAEGWDVSLVGHRVVMDLEWFKNTKGYNRLRTLRTRPYRRPEPVAAAPSRKSRPRLDDDDEN
jgi:hypothetical protein